MRKFISIMAMLMCFICMSAQQLTPMPLDPKVKSGKLPNGLEYFILHNEEPKERANFYIAQKVGSTLETPEQLGLAHFLEHMAFNGTSHYPGKNMLNYLQSKGIRFGADINAYTAFDETVYNINNVPTTDKALMDSVLLVLHDWSGSILLEEAEIDAERGVIQEEWRQRNDASTRMMTQILPKIYAEYQYQQMPIGKMEVVRNFPYDVLRDYYHKWYRPDQQGIVIVGDFDVDEMEKKVVALFSEIPMPENAAERTYPVVSGNQTPIYVSFEDPETQQSVVRASIKHDMFPVEYRNTVESFAFQDLMPLMVTQMINHRLSDASQELECPFAYAATMFDQFYVSKRQGSFDIIVLPKEDPLAAYQAAMEIVARACKTGFTDAELERVTSEILSSYDQTYNERNNTSTSSLAKQLISHFVDNEPYAGIEQEYELVKMLMTQFNVQAFNELASTLITPENNVIVFYRPASEKPMPEEGAMTAVIPAAMARDYEPLVDEAITEPLIKKLPKKGKIKNATTCEKLGAEVLTLSNGVKVIIKKTDFKADEIIMEAYANGGKRTYSPADRENVLFMEDAYELSKLGNFDQKTLRKYLAGKQVGLSFSVGNVLNVLDGSCAVKDLPTLMELIYASFTDLNPDAKNFEVSIEQMRPFLANQDKNPQKIFRDVWAKTKYPENSLLHNIKVEDLDKIDYNASLALVKEALADAANFTFVFVGNVDSETIRPLLEQYIATLPVKKKHAVPAIQSNLSAVRGVKNVTMEVPMENDTQSKVLDEFSGTGLEYNTYNNICLQMTADILDMIYTETIREEMGATYGASVFAMMAPTTDPVEWHLIYLFDTNADVRDAAVARCHTELDKLLNNGTTAEYFNKVKEAMQKQFEINVRTNGHWLNRIVATMRDLDTMSDYEEVLNSVTLEKLNAFMKDLNVTDNRIEIIINGAPNK